MLITDPIDLNRKDDDIVVPMTHTSGPEGVRQNIEFNVKLFKGEWFLNLDVGVPWLPGNGVSEAEAILGQKFDDVKVRGALRPVILRVPGVSSIVSLNVAFDRPTREVRIFFEVLTVFGDTVADTLKVAA